MPDPVGLDLARRQLDGIAVWHRQRRAQELAALSARTREQRLDRTRRMAVLREEHRAIVAATEAQLRASRLLLPRTPRAVVAHRDDWFAGKLSEGLEARGVAVVASPHNGAEAVGVVVAEQPDLVLVEDVLPMLSGEDVVREVVTCAPRTVLAAQVAHDDGIGPMIEAGARAAWVRRVPPADVVQGLLALLQPRCGDHVD